MRIDVIREPEEGSREEWHFTFFPEYLRLSFIRYQAGERLWVYPDFHNKSTIEKPEPPGDVLMEARQIITQKISFDI